MLNCYDKGAFVAQFFKPRAKKVKPEVRELVIESLNHEGVGVARDNNKVCFVEGALSGEVVKAKQIQSKARFDSYVTQKVMQASVHRTSPFCQHFGSCGGCQLQHLSPAQQVEEKQIAVSALFNKFAGLAELPWQAPLEDRDQGYRRSARIAVFYDRNKKRFHFGYRKKGAKSIIAIDECAVLDGAYQEIFRQFSNLLPSLSKGKGITHVQLCSADSGNYVVIRHIQALPNKDQQALLKLGEKHNWNIVFDDGESSLTYHHGYPYYQLDEYDLTMSFQLTNFIQVNAEINQQMIEQALGWLSLNSESKVLDLFCGIGNFTLPLARVSGSVVGVEGVDIAIEMAKFNAQQNEIENATFYCQDLTQNMAKESWFAIDYDVLLLDPSRAGAEQILAQLALSRFKQILYVSCDPVTMARDVKQILAAGFEMKKIGLMNMFPHTAHIETMALFERSK